MVTLVDAGAVVVVMLNFAEVAPASTVTLAGVLAIALELLNVTTAPVDGAGPFSIRRFPSTRPRPPTP